MFEIKIDGINAELGKDPKMKVSLANPHLDYENFLPARKVILPELPNTALNRSLINYFNFLQSGAGNTRHRVDNYFNGHLISSGIFVITEGGDDGFTGGVVENLGEFFGEYQSKLLTEIDLGSIEIPEELTPVITGVADQEACCFPMVDNPDYYGSSPGAYTGTMNDYLAGDYLANSPKVPFFFLKYILERIADLTGTKITGDFMEHPQLADLVFVCIREIESEEIQVRNFVPDLKVGELFLELRKLFNLKFTPDALTRTLRLDFFDQDLRAVTSINWSDKVVRGGKRIPEQKKRIQLDYEIDSNDALVKDRPELMKAFLSEDFYPELSTGILPIKSKISTTNYNSSGDGHAALSQQGTTTVNSQQDKKGSARLIFWNGMVSDKPKASPVSEGPTMFFNGESGLAQFFYKNTILKQENQFFYKVNMLLNEADVASLDFSQKIYINGLDYLLVSAENNLPVTESWSCVFVKI